MKKIIYLLLLSLTYISMGDDKASKDILDTINKIMRNETRTTTTKTSPNFHNPSLVRHITKLLEEKEFRESFEKNSEDIYESIRQVRKNWPMYEWTDKDGQIKKSFQTTSSNINTPITVEMLTFFSKKENRDNLKNKINTILREMKEEEQAEEIPKNLNNLRKEQSKRYWPAIFNSNNKPTKPKLDIPQNPPNTIPNKKYPSQTH